MPQDGTSEMSKVPSVTTVERPPSGLLPRIPVKIQSLLPSRGMSSLAFTIATRQPADARWLRWKAARGVTRTSRSGPNLIRWIYGALTGHGYYPLVAVLWLIAVLVPSALFATHRADFAPTAPIGLPTPDGIQAAGAICVGGAQQGPKR